MELRQSAQNQPELVLENTTDVEAAYCAVHGLESWCEMSGPRIPRGHKRLKRRINKLHSKAVLNNDLSILPAVINDRKGIANLGLGARRLLWPFLRTVTPNLPEGYSMRYRPGSSTSKFMRGPIAELYYTIAENGSFGFPLREMIASKREERQRRDEEWGRILSARKEGGTPDVVFPHTASVYSRDWD